MDVVVVVVPVAVVHSSGALKRGIGKWNLAMGSCSIVLSHQDEGAIR